MQDSLHTYNHHASLLRFLCLLALFAQARIVHAQNWLPILPEELNMTSEPKAPGAPAIYLYRQFDRDNTNATEFHYIRIKILTEEGRKYADVQIPFIKGEGGVKHIQARTIHPDGTIIDFTGTIYDKTIVKAKRIKVFVKTFALPEITVGSIIEYRYDLEIYFPIQHWLLSDSLFTRHARFSLHHGAAPIIEWDWPLGLPSGTKPPFEDHDTIRMETQDVPAFQAEEYMPPADEMKYRIEFNYVAHGEKEPERFWKKEGTSQYLAEEDFIRKRKAMEAAVAEIVDPADSPEIKLRKLYARTQAIHNSSYEHKRTKQELEREKVPRIETVEDVWKHNYGNYFAVSWLFLALARAAGFEAEPILTSTREEHFFNRARMNARSLNSSVIAVKLNDKEIYLDPATPFTPFGLLAWYKNDVPGLLLDKDGGKWVVTPQAPASESRIERKANLRLSEDGSLEGTATVTFTGIEALWRRLYEYGEDDQVRRNLLENELKEYIPSNIDVELTNKPDWNSAETNLVAQFSLKIQGWGSSSGRRVLLPVGIFGGTEKHVFEHANRTYPIYFNSPYEDWDDVTIALPPGMQVSGVPESRLYDIKSFTYRSDVQQSEKSLHLTRQLTVSLASAEVKYYGSIRGFFQHVRSADEQPVVLSVSPQTSQN